MIFKAMLLNPIEFPRLLIAGLQGGAGKTTLSVGIIAAWRRSGKTIAPFKKGPDYIDAGWLALAAGRPCYNLDTFLIPPPGVVQSFIHHAESCDIAVIEGNRGLYDGIDLNGRTSSAEIAKLLGVPVILCVDGTKMTRTMAAVVSGCQAFDADLRFGGVILNRIAGVRHETNLRRNIEHHCGVPVVGAVPKLHGEHFPERHMGLVPTPEHKTSVDAIDMAANVAEKYLDLDFLASIAEEAGRFDVSRALATEAVGEFPEMPSHPSPVPDQGEPPPKIGVIRDSAFQFYYPDNIEALKTAGAEILFMDACCDGDLPEVDAIYIGGGFPETHAENLAKNATFMHRLKSLAEAGLPVYAECGGLIYLGEALEVHGSRYPMVGVLPIVFGIEEKPQGLGYTVVSVDRENPFHPVGAEIRGHEFRYSRVLEWRGSDADMAFEMKRGTGFANRRDGISYKNVFATYTHIHALGVPAWATAMVANARSHQNRRSV